MNQISEAAAALRTAGSIAAVADKLGLSTRSVAAYRSGAKVPSHETRRRIAEVFPAVSAANWDRVAAARQPEAPADEPTEAPTGDATPATTLRRLQQQRDRIAPQRAAGGLTGRAAIEIEKLELAVNQAISKVEDLTGAAILEHPIFVRIADAIVEALASHPLALLECEETIASIIADPACGGDC
jgi:transcriptional regulator with XRE-family HTH domain